MIIYTKQGKYIDINWPLIALSGGVWVTPFKNGETYTDPFDASVWTWDNMNDYTDEVLGIVQNGKNLIPVTSYADCLALEGSFYYDDANGLLYILFFGYKYAISEDTHLSSIAVISAGFASGYNKTTKNVFDGVYYKPLITDVSGFSKKVDPLKFGLIAFETSSYTITDQINNFSDLAGPESVGVPVWAYLVEDDATELTNADRIYTAYKNGYSHNRESLTTNLVEVRLFENKIACPNVLALATYPDAGDNKDTVIPVAWGDVRRGHLLLINGGALDTDIEATAIFLVADPALYPIIAINNIFDEKDNTIAIDTLDLSACTVEITKPAGVSVSDLNKYTWGGQGYGIDGDYNNGLDIARAAFLKLATTPFLQSTFDVDNWTTETAKNTQPIGFTVQSDKGFIEEIIQPISVSLQGGFDILGDGRISFSSRDITAPVSLFIPASKQIDEPDIQQDPEKIVSEILVEYSPNPEAKTALQYLYDTDKALVSKNYGINRRDPISPFKTVLFNESDAANAAAQISATSKAPERLINVPANQIYRDLRLFSIVKIDTGTLDAPKYEYGELLGFTPALLPNTETLTIRILPDYIDTEPTIFLMGRLFSDGQGVFFNLCADGTGESFNEFQITGEA